MAIKDVQFKFAVNQLLELGLSVETIASKMQVSSATVRNWAAGYHVPGGVVRDSIYSMLYREKKRHEKAS